MAIFTLTMSESHIRSGFTTVCLLDKVVFTSDCLSRFWINALKKINQYHVLLPLLDCKFNLGLQVRERLRVALERVTQLEEELAGANQEVRTLIGQGNENGANSRQANTVGCMINDNDLILTNTKLSKKCSILHEQAKRLFINYRLIERGQWIFRKEKICFYLAYGGRWSNIC